MTQVNLLPSDVRERQRSRRLTALAISAVFAVVALLFFVFLLQAARVASANDELAAQKATNAELQGKIAQLQEFADLKAALAARQGLADAALSGRVLWSGVLRDVSMVIPGKVWLTGMVGTVNVQTQTSATPAAPGATPTVGSSPAPAAVSGETLIGSIQFQGMATDHPSVALWLSRLEQVTGWVNPWISNATETESEGGAVTIQWAGSIDLTSDATVQGVKQ